MEEQLLIFPLFPTPQTYSQPFLLRFPEFWYFSVNEFRELPLLNPGYRIILLPVRQKISSDDLSGFINQ